MSNREKSVEWFLGLTKWFLGLTEAERIEMKKRYFHETYIEYSDKWGYHFSFGQIEEMYNKEQTTNPH